MFKTNEGVPFNELLRRSKKKLNGYLDFYV